MDIEISALIGRADYLLDAQKNKLKRDLEGYYPNPVGREAILELLHHLFNINESDLSPNDMRMIDEFLSDSTH